MKLHIRQAQPSELEAVRDFYWDLADEMREADYGPAWTRGIYPSEADLCEHIEAGELYLAEAEIGPTPASNGATFAGAVVVNRHCNEEYTEVAWPSGATADEAVVVHLLCIAPEYQGQGLGRQLVAFAVDRASVMGARAVRLDVLDGNLPAARLYESCGFAPVTRIELFYEDTGRVMFILYELAL